MEDYYLGTDNYEDDLIYEQSPTTQSPDPTDAPEEERVEEESFGKTEQVEEAVANIEGGSNLEKARKMLDQLNDKLNADREKDIEWDKEHGIITPEEANRQLAELKGDNSAATPQPQLGSAGYVESDTSGDPTRRVSKDEKIERTTEAIAEMSDAITVPNSFGELSTYTARRQYDGGPVVYWEEAYRTELEQMVYTRLRDQRVIKKAKCRLAATDSNVNMVTNTLLHATYTKLGIGRRKTVMLTSKYIGDRGQEIEATYYDMRKGELVEYSNLDSDLKEKCFSRFCNTTSEVQHVPIIPEEEVNLKLVQEYANKAYSDLEAWYKAYDAGRSTAGLYKNRFDDTFMVWACKDEELYRDIITMCATPLLIRKPECTFFILGEQSNGKSSLRHLLQCAYGARNCASVQVAQMGSWDYASTLLGKTVNFPDEEKTNLEDMDIASFKSMSTHENLQIRKKGSSVPFDIPCDFVSIIPINTYPNWKALDGGVARRVRILPFNADLSAASQKGGKSFEETHYTPEFISKFIGEIIGVASFYTRTGRDIVWSEVTESASSDWKKEKVNAPIFKQDFEKIFRGFQSHNLLYECYQSWCKGGLGDVDTGIDYQFETKKRLKEVFTQFGGYNKKINIRTQSGGVHITKGEKPCPIEWCLWEGATVDVGHIGGLDWGTERGVMTVREILDMGADPVTLKLMEQGLCREDSPETNQPGAQLELLNE